MSNLRKLKEEVFFNRGTEGFNIHAVVPEDDVYYKELEVVERSNESYGYYLKRAGMLFNECSDYAYSIECISENIAYEYDVYNSLKGLTNIENGYEGLNLYSQIIHKAGFKSMEGIDKKKEGFGAKVLETIKNIFEKIRQALANFIGGVKKFIGKILGRGSEKLPLIGKWLKVKRIAQEKIEAIGAGAGQLVKDPKKILGIVQKAAGTFGMLVDVIGKDVKAIRSGHAPSPEEMQKRRDNLLNDLCQYAISKNFNDIMDESGGDIGKALIYGVSKPEKIKAPLEAILGVFPVAEFLSKNSKIWEAVNKLVDNSGKLVAVTKDAAEAIDGTIDAAKAGKDGDKQQMMIKSWKALSASMRIVGKFSTGLTSACTNITETIKKGMGLAEKIAGKLGIGGKKGESEDESNKENENENKEENKEKENRGRIEQLEEQIKEKEEEISKTKNNKQKNKLKNDVKVLKKVLHKEKDEGEDATKKFDELQNSDEYRDRVLESKDEYGYFTEEDTDII